MKLKKMVKKGGVADIVSLMIIVGIVIALIMAVVIPMVKDAYGSGDETHQNQAKINDEVSNISVPVDAN